VFTGKVKAFYKHLRQVLVFLNMCAINRPEVIVASADEKIDEKGRVIDEKTREKIMKLLESLVNWTRRLKEERKRLF